VADETTAGIVWMEQDGVTYQGTWRLENGIVSLYVGDFGPMSTQAGSLGAAAVARLLMREFLDGRKRQQDKLK
jgi:hypothetical protein